MSRKVDEARLNKIKTLAERGYTRREISQTTGIHYSSVGRTIREHGIKCDPDITTRGKMSGPTFWTEDKIFELDRLRDSGLSWWDCGKAINAPAGSCTQVYNRRGVYAKYPKRTTEES